MKNISRIEYLLGYDILPESFGFGIGVKKWIIEIAQVFRLDTNLLEEGMSFIFFVLTSVFREE